jgi:hypothetical protein
VAHYRQELAFYALERRVTLTLPSPYLGAMPSRLTVEGGTPGSPHAWRTVEVVSYEEAFKRELVELEAAIRGRREPAWTCWTACATSRSAVRSPGRTSPAAPSTGRARYRLGPRTN